MEWRAHTTQICRIKVAAEKHRQEILTMTNVIQDAIKKNNIIFTKKWEATHDCINCRSEEILLLKNRVVAHGSVKKMPTELVKTLSQNASIVGRNIGEHRVFTPTILVIL